MKKLVKDFWWIVGCVILALVIGAETVHAINCWDEKMSDQEITSLLEKYPDSKRLNELAEKRNLK